MLQRCKKNIQEKFYAYSDLLMECRAKTLTSWKSNGVRDFCKIHTVRIRTIAHGIKHNKLLKRLNAERLTQIEKLKIKIHPPTANCQPPTANRQPPTAII